MQFGSVFSSSGLSVSEGIVAGAGRVGSSPAGYERGSGRFALDRDEDEDAIEGALLLLLVEEENDEAIDKRDRHDDPDEDVADELAVLVDMKDEAVELRPEVSEREYN